MTLDQVHDTLDKTLQQYVVCYKPAAEVLVFVFLLSETGNSLAIWRKKLAVPHDIFAANKELVDQTLEMQEQGRVVYIDEWVSRLLWCWVVLTRAPRPFRKAEPEPPPVPPKKKSLWRKIFSLFKSKKSKSKEASPA